MNEPARFTNRLREVRRKSDHIVVRRLLDLVDALDGESSARFDLLESVARNRAHLGMDLAHGDFHVEPFLKLVLLGPECAHLGQCVTFDHFNAVELTKSRASSQRPLSSINVKVSIPSPCSKRV